MTSLQALQALTPYPVPSATLQDIAEECGLDTMLTHQVRTSREMKRAKALVYLYVAAAPNISQGGVSFSLSSDERKQLRKVAAALLKEIGDPACGLGVKYGYAGENF